MFKLRNYQQAGVDKGIEFLTTGNKKDIPIIVAPTAAGKSIYIANMAKTLQAGVLVLQPTKELLEQNYAKFEAYGGQAGIYSASMNSKEIGHVTFATIGSIKKNPEMFSHVRYIIIDECHLVPPKDESMFMSFISQLKDVRVVGLTATAFRLKSYHDPFSGEPFSKINLLPRERPRFFNRFLHVTQIFELYQQGFLSPIKYVKLPWDSSLLKVNTTGAEFTTQSMEFAMNEQLIFQGIINVVDQSIDKGRKHRLVFVQSVSDAEKLAKKCKGSACVSADTPKAERSRIIDEFKAGKIKTVFNVGVLTVGFDFPELDTIIIARPTMSLSLYMQMIGRGIRVAPGKDHCTVVDMCGNVDRFGQIERIVYLYDEKLGWILHNGEKQLSGVRMDSF